DQIRAAEGLEHAAAARIASATRVKEMDMSIENLKNLLPEYAKDIKLNLSTLAADETLTTQQLWGAFLCTALAAGNETVIREIAAEAAQRLTPEAQTAAKAAA